MLNILTKGSLRDTLSVRENRLVLALMIRESYKVVDDDDNDDNSDDSDSNDNGAGSDSGVATSPDAHFNTLLVGVAEGS